MQIWARMVSAGGGELLVFCPEFAEPEPAGKHSRAGTVDGRSATRVGMIVVESPDLVPNLVPN